MAGTFDKEIKASIAESMGDYQGYTPNDKEWKNLSEKDKQAYYKASKRSDEITMDQLSKQSPEQQKKYRDYRDNHDAMEMMMRGMK